MKTNKAAVLGAVVAAICLASAAAYAVAVDGGKPKLDPKADALLRTFCETVQALPRFSCDVTLTMKTASEGMKQEIETTYGFAMEKPNKIALRHKRGAPANTVVCDGGKLYVALVNRYEVKEAPKTLEDLFQSAPMAGNMLFLDNLLRTDVYAAIMDGVTQTSYVGREAVDGKECDRLSFKQDEFDWDMWITTNDKPVVVKVLTDMSKSMATMRADMPGVKSASMTVENHFENWSSSGELAKDTFVFVPPEGAKKVASLFEGMDEEAPDTGEDAASPSELVGRPAPAFNLAAVDGGKARLPDPGLTNAVVVLDFWATWSGPGRKELPIVAKVAAAYKDKGVVLWAVNEQEPEDRIGDYLKKLNVTCPVALDRDGEVGGLYRVRSIPQTVIVGKDGKIRAIHVGAVSDLEATLTHELDVLTEGRPLPEAKAPPEGK